MPRQTQARSQPVPQVGNRSGRRRDNGPRSEKAKSQSQLASASVASYSSQISSRRNSSPPISTSPDRGRRAKHARKNTAHNTAYTELETEPDRQEQLEMVHLSDNSQDEYQDSRASAGTESDGEIDPAETDITDSTGTLQRQSSQEAMSRTGRLAGLVTVSTISEPRETPPTRPTPASRIIRSRVYSPPAFLSSSPLGRRNVLTPTIRSSSPGYNQESSPGQDNLSSGVKSRRSTAVGGEKDLLDRTKALILRYTLFHNPLPNTTTLNAKVRSVWAVALGGGRGAGCIEPS
ncbi:hypothetical protein HOY82DRAFT_389613 [Tuber indicum]|nr:hypothetical protein HOY82DRAFT_389613 [Tuber indicum]